MSDLIATSELTSQSLPALRESPRRNRDDMKCHRCPEFPLRSQCPHTEQGRLYLSSFKTTKEKRHKAPARCSKCPNRPLRSQCSHTEAGKRYLREQAIQVELAGSVSLTPSSHLPASGSSTPLPVSVSATPSSQPSPPTEPEPAAPIPLESTPVPAVTAAAPLQLGNSSQPTVSITNDPAIDPFLDATPLTRTEALGSRFMSGRDISGGSTSVSTTPSSFPSSSPFLMPTKESRKHERATKANPFHGFVKGPMRGTQAHEIFRRDRRPEPLLDSKEASKTFLEQMNRLVERAEDISVKTGCWLFVGAQHPAGVGATIHYTSPRLLRDAPDDMDAIVNDYHGLMTNLLQARRAEALELAKKYQESISENQAMVARVNDLEAQMLTMKQAIEAYQAQLFSDAPTTSA